MTYQEIKKQNPVMFECFFAFGKDQFKAGVEKHGLEGKKLFDAGGGLVGTHEGIKKFFADIDAITDQVTAECDPQLVYDYEFNNHECSYTNNDEEAINLVVDYFGAEKAKQVKRKFAYYKIS